MVSPASGAGAEGPVSREAARWVLRSDRGLTAAEQDALSEWMAADPRHAAEFARHRRLWRRLDQLGDWKPAHSAVPNPDLLAPRPDRKMRWFAIALTLAAALTLVLLVRPVRGPGDVAIASAADVTRRTLADGSTVELNRDAVLTVNFAATERRVRLEQGEAFFQVAKDTHRPFIVTAGDIEVRAIGTAFSVQREAAKVNVLVTEGQVGLLSARPEILAATEISEGSSVFPGVPVLKANQRAVVSLLLKPAPLQIATLTETQVSDALAWQHRLLDFTEVPLEKVVAEFNRANAIHIVLADRELASIPISASFRSDNVEGLLRLVEKGFDAEIERQGTRTIVLRRKR